MTPFLAPRTCVRSSATELRALACPASASANNLNVVGLQSCTDGASNTGLFSERLISGYPSGSTATVYSSGIPGYRAIFQGTYAAAPNSVTAANLMNGSTRS